MSGLFEKIYDEVISYEEDIAEMNKSAEQANERASLRYKGKLGEREWKELVELLDDTALRAGREGFYMGIRYAFRGMAALFRG